MVLTCKNLEYPISKDAFCQVWLKLAQSFLRRFFNFVNVSLLFGNYFPLVKGVILHLKKLQFSCDQRILCAKFGLNWPSGCGEEDFKFL